MLDEFYFENGFYHTCKSERIYKIINQYELFKQTKDIEGDILEFGVFKGASLIRFASFRDFLSITHKNIFGFDTFNKYPYTKESEDINVREKFINESGEKSISLEHLNNVFRYKNINNIILIEGDICETLDRFLNIWKNIKISFINIDVDLYEPSKIILERLYNKVSTNGIILLDDYNVFPGETKAVNSFIKDMGIEITKYNSLYYIRK